MFDWVLNTPLNTIAIFLPGVFKLKLLTFSNFFQQFFSRRIQNPVKHSTMELFKYFFFAKFTRKHLCWSLILIKLQVSILQFHLKKGLQHRCFLVHFARYLRDLFYRTPRGDYFCSTEIDIACKENNHTDKTKT